ncbi:hypothetical protein HED49_06340 [Ochrobactrum daejeonense]|nr:hypothetical protein [Brucella daejeonensis]
MSKKHSTQRRHEKPSCIINGSEEPKVLLWGDSNAAHYIGLLGELAKRENASFRNVEHSSCPPILEDGYKFTTPQEQSRCKKSLEVVIPILKNYDHIIISSLYTSYAKSQDFLPSLRKTIESLVSQGKRVTVIGQAVNFSRYDQYCGQKSLKTGINCEELFIANTGPVFSINKQLKNLVSEIPNATYVDFNSLICPGSLLALSQRPAIYYDSGHISMTGSWMLGREAVSSTDFDGIIFQSNNREITSTQ